MIFSGVIKGCTIDKVGKAPKHKRNPHAIQQSTKCLVNVDASLWCHSMLAAVPRHDMLAAVPRHDMLAAGPRQDMLAALTAASARKSLSQGCTVRLTQAQTSCMMLDSDRWVTLSIRLAAALTAASNLCCTPCR